MTNTSTMQTKTNGRSLPKGWQWVKLGDICEINPRRPALERADSTPTTFVQMSAVDDLLGIIARPEQRPYSEIKKGYTYFAENDVIFAKITPCMENGKHAIARNLIDRIGFGSTEFHVIRPNENIIAEWIWYFVRQPYVRQNATNHFTGAVGQQRVPDGFIKSLDIPLPPLDEQRRIASQLNAQLAAVESAREAAEVQLQAAYLLPSVYLRDVFEEVEKKLPSGWHWVRFGDICHFKRGPFGGSLKKDIFVESGYKVYEQQHAIQDNFDIGRYYITEEKYKEMEIFAIKPNDLLMSCSGTMGKLAIVPQNAKPGIINQALLKLTPVVEKITPSYLKAYLQSETVQKTYILGAAGTAIQNVAPVSELKEIKIPVPPVKEQETLVRTLEEKYQFSNSLIYSLESQLAEIESLPASLLREAFAGQG